ncbi:MAG TPA: hypothetical protein VIJ40_01885 [Acidimicrobiales bacterium]
MSHRKGLLLLVILLVIGTAAWWRWSSSSTGDPGGKVLAQLSPVMTALPAEVSTHYVWNMEPHQDSCDGMAGTFGWSQVVVQSGFSFRGPPRALFDAMSKRLSELGWKVRSQEGSSSTPNYGWHKTLTNGSYAQVNVQRSLDSSAWELVATAPPVGTVASGC